MKILFVNLEGHVGGAERSLLLLCKELVNTHEISVACPEQRALSSELKNLNISVHPLPNRPTHNQRSWSNIVHWLKVSYRLLIIVLQWKPNLIHANSFLCSDTLFICRKTA